MSDQRVKYKGVVVAGSRSGSPPIQSINMKIAGMVKRHNYHHNTANNVNGFNSFFCFALMVPWNPGFSFCGSLYLWGLASVLSQLSVFKLAGLVRCFILFSLWSIIKDHSIFFSAHLLSCISWTIALIPLAHCLASEGFRAVFACRCHLHKTLFPDSGFNSISTQFHSCTCKALPSFLMNTRVKLRYTHITVKAEPYHIFFISSCSPRALTGLHQLRPVSIRSLKLASHRFIRKEPKLIRFINICPAN